MVLSKKINNIKILEKELLFNIDNYRKNLNEGDNKKELIYLQKINSNNLELKDELNKLLISKDMNNFNNLNQIEIDKFKTIYNNYSNIARELNELDENLITLKQKNIDSNENYLSIKLYFKFILIFSILLILLVLKFVVFKNLNIIYIILIIFLVTIIFFLPFILNLIIK